MRLNFEGCCIFSWKINKYMGAALKKNIYLNATILDPRYKLEALKGKSTFETKKKQFHD